MSETPEGAAGGAGFGAGAGPGPGPASGFDNHHTALSGTTTGTTPTEEHEGALNSVAKGAGAGANGTSRNSGSEACVLTPSLARDPGPLECPCDSCAGVLDCQRRHPVRSPCCSRIMCFKCAGVRATLPEPGPCPFCGATPRAELEVEAFKRDAGVLLAIAGTVPALEREDCYDCKRDGVAVEAPFWCIDDTCAEDCSGLRPVCSAHVAVHTARDHAVEHRTHEAGMSKEALPDVSHCSLCGNKGPAGALTHACDGNSLELSLCPKLMCATCALKHASIHNIRALKDATASAGAILNDAIQELTRHRTEVAGETAKARTDLASLPAKHAAAAAALHRSLERQQAQLQAQYEAHVAELDAAFQSKGAALRDFLVRARAVVGEVATLRLACQRAAESPDPLTRAQVSRSAALTLRNVKACAASWPTLDATLEFAAPSEADDGPRLGTLGRVVTTWLATEHCTLVWDTPEPWVTPMQRVTVTLDLRAHDRTRATAVPLKVVTMYLKSCAERVYPNLQTALVAPGVFQATVDVRHSTADGTELSVSATVQGRLVAESPTVRVFKCPPLTWVPVRELCQSSFDRQLPRTALLQCAKGGLPLPSPGFLGRTTLIRPDSHDPMEFQLEVTTGTAHAGCATAKGKVIIAVGRRATIEHASAGHSSNEGLDFFYDTFYGTVNVTPSRVSHLGRSQLRVMSMAEAGVTYVVRFRVCQRTLTWHAGKRGQVLERQPHQWVVPSEFYLLVACRHYGDGYSFRVSYV